MQGVLGVKPYLPKSSELVNFTARFKTRFRRENLGIQHDDPTMFQFWAYDTVWALALAAEKAGASGPRFLKPQTGDNFTDLNELGVSQTGEGLLHAVLNTKFRGMDGEFKLVDGQLQSRAYQIVNVIGNGVRGVGFWNQKSGLFGRFSSNSTNRSPVAPLKRIIWPGDPTDIPKGWEFPTSGMKLKIGVPVKGFNQFVKVEWDPTTNATTVSGYCIDVFEAVMQSMPYAVPYEYKPFRIPSTAYNVHMHYMGNFDAVVGDVTIVANRSKFVDFTLPFTESGVSLVVPVDVVGSKNEWIFLRPLNIRLWLGSLAFFFFTGFVVWAIEHRINEEFRGTRLQQLGLISYFSFSTLVFAHKEKLKSNLSKFVVIIWVFVVLILTSSYTASLTSMLTMQQLQPKVMDISDLKSSDKIGYQDGSFTEGLLDQMGFQKHRRVNLSSPDDYADALLRGSKNGGVAAIFDELPYLRLFLSEHCNNYSIVGQTSKTDGFGFVFPKGSSLVPDVNRAVLNVTEGDTMTRIEMKWFGDTSACQAQSDNLSFTTLHFRNFGGLFLITGVISLLALLIFLVHFIYKERVELKAAFASNNSLSSRLVSWAKHYDQMDKNATDFKSKNPTVEDENFGRHDEHALEGTPVVAALQQNPEGSQSPFSISNYSDVSFGVPEEGISSSTEPGNPANQTFTDMIEIREV